MSNSNIPPQENLKGTPLGLLPQLCPSNQYVSAKEITSLSIEIYKTKGRGITFTDLLERGIASAKPHAQDMLKYHATRRKTLFTLDKKRPQQYYPTEIKSEIFKKKLQESTPIEPSGVASSSYPSTSSIPKHPLTKCMEPVIMQSLEGYILPLLPKAPIYIHNMHFKTKITNECYAELDLPIYDGNGGKYLAEVIGDTHVDYIFYRSGAVNISTTCSKKAYKLETEEDRSRIIAFFGQIRDRLILLLCDRHERLVPDIMEWQLTEADINRDIKVSDLFHITGIKIQVRHMDHLFRLYIKSLYKDTVFRVEESKYDSTKKSTIQFINDVFNPNETLENRLEAFRQEMNQKLDSITRSICCRSATSTPSVI